MTAIGLIRRYFVIAVIQAVFALGCVMQIESISKSEIPDFEGILAEKKELAMVLEDVLQNTVFPATLHIPHKEKLAAVLREKGVWLRREFHVDGAGRGADDYRFPSEMRYSRKSG